MVNRDLQRRKRVNDWGLGVTNRNGGREEQAGDPWFRNRWIEARLSLVEMCGKRDGEVDGIRQKFENRSCS